jgi:hypothetical protein
MIGNRQLVKRSLGSFQHLSWEISTQGNNIGYCDA